MINAEALSRGDAETLANFLTGNHSPKEFCHGLGRNQGGVHRTIEGPGLLESLMTYSYLSCVSPAQRLCVKS